MQPRTFLDRAEVAHTCTATLHIAFPTLVDGMDNRVERAYEGWPDRLYIIGADQKVLYKSGPGPAGFRVSELTEALAPLMKKMPATESAQEQR